MLDRVRLYMQLMALPHSDDYPVALRVAIPAGKNLTVAMSCTIMRRAILNTNLVMCIKIMFQLT